MNTRLQLAAALAAIGLSSFVAAYKAEACGVTGMQNYAGRNWSMPGLLSHLQTAAHGPSANPAYINPLQFIEPITGLYAFTMTAQGNAPPGPPDGVVVDQGFVSWHADGTETMNSGRPAYSSNFCMGAWAQTGAHSYQLNHYALAWDTVNGQTFVGPANIRESIQLAPGNNSYSGNFTLVQYAQDGTTVLAQVKGVVSASRITAGN